MNKHCQSCGMMLADQKSDRYCRYCAHEKGKLKSREEIRAGIAAWLEQFTPDKKNVDFQKRADSCMNAMPDGAK
ncbi:MAG: hypothetical protein JXB88_06095 [Spirochaetales bacterium]|nr:hypothetical protein [Spirochaetales bacterium]